jgi:hypothetical protein
MAVRPPTPTSPISKQYGLTQYKGDGKDSQDKDYRAWLANQGLSSAEVDEIVKKHNFGIGILDERAALHELRRCVEESLKTLERKCWTTATGKGSF